MFTFLLIVQALVAAALVAAILMQRSEGGGLGVGGSSSGFMTARGQADFLTRATAILGTIFVTLCIVLAAIAGATDRTSGLDTSLVDDSAAAAPVAPVDPTQLVLPESTDGTAPATTNQAPAGE